MRPLSILILLASSVFAQKPDLRAGGPSPSEISNHEVTTVKLPGSHLTGATVEAKGACRLASYKVVSATEIQMRLEGARPIDAKEDGCFFTVRTAAGSAGGWLVVSLTPEEEKEKHSREVAASRTKMEAMVHAAGKKWVIRFADGASNTYTAKEPDEPGMPEFQTGDGHTAKIFVQPDGSVVLMEEGCVRRGRLVEGRVKNGDSMTGCEHHPGAWSATVEP
jgi:hypothetical protein